jgi:hypothetical protein
MEIKTVGELLHWSYANLAMAHSAITAKAEKYGRTQFMIRSRLYAGLNKQTMSIGPLADDERLKMVLPQACCYCGSRDYLSVDHLIPTKRGGANTGDNLVWACRSCNSSKCARDALEWLVEKNQFPPILLLRRYLKLAIEMSRERNLHGYTACRSTRTSILFICNSAGIPTAQSITFVGGGNGPTRRSRRPCASSRASRLNSTLCRTLTHTIRWFLCFSKQSSRSAYIRWVRRSSASSGVSLFLSPLRTLLTN